MKCVKTGVDLYLRSHGLYMHGDLHVPFLPTDDGRNAEIGIGLFDWLADEVNTRPMGGQQPRGVLSPVNLLARVCYATREPQSSRLHLLVEREDVWLDQGELNTRMNSTLLIRANLCRWLGYDGMPLEEVFAK